MNRWIPMLLAGACLASCEKQTTQKPLEQVIVSLQRKGMLGHDQYSTEKALHAVCYGTDVLRDKPCAWNASPVQEPYRADFETFHATVEQLLEKVYNDDEKANFLETMGEGIRYDFRRNGKNAELKLHWYAVHRPDAVDMSRKDPTDWFTPVELKMTMTALEGRVQMVDITETSLALQRPIKELRVHASPADKEPWPELAIPFDKDRETQLNDIYTSFVKLISQ